MKIVKNISKNKTKKVNTNSPFRGFPTTMPPSRGLHHTTSSAGGALILAALLLEGAQGLFLGINDFQNFV